MFWLDRLRALAPRRRTLCAETDSVRRIAAALDHTSPARACFLAAFAYVLSRAARADGEITDAETQRMVAIMERIGELSTAIAANLVEIAKAQHRAFGGTEDFLVTREFRRMTTPNQRVELLDCLFLVSAADGGISSAEEAQIRQVASELGCAPHLYLAVRMNWSHQRNVLRSFRKAVGARSSDQT